MEELLKIKKKINNFQWNSFGGNFFFMNTIIQKIYTREKNVTENSRSRL